jgi:hypothetical protein
MKKLITVLLMLFFVAGCSAVTTQSMKDFSVNYKENSVAFRELAQITAQDWLIGSGALTALLEGRPNAEWVIEALQDVNVWFYDEDMKEIENPILDSWQLGYILGKRASLTGPVFRLMLEQYAPGIFNILEAGAFLAFLGL